MPDGLGKEGDPEGVDPADEELVAEALEEMKELDLETFLATAPR